ncbi:hypothetical protein [Streptomyces sp. NPDC053367]|uniref:hypothetical protein n=1 Tax=Streptomyces sp. NPDC053367 TaxID=3365700 RepID=UPI0037CEF61F
MSVDPVPAEVSSAADQVAVSMIELWRRARADAAPTVSEEQMRGLLALAAEPSDPGGVAGSLGVSPSSATRLLDRLEQRTLVRHLPSGEFCLTGAGKCVLEATRERRRQLLEQTVVTASPSDRPVLRDVFDQLYGVVSPVARVPHSRRPR